MGFQGEDYDDGKVATAFALVVAAGGATAVGASGVWFPRIVQLAQKRTLAASLGLAAGVMLYVSLVDIYGKAITGFEQQGHDEGDAFIYTTLAFFAGILLMMFLHWVVKILINYEKTLSLEELMDQAVRCENTVTNSDENVNELEDGQGDGDDPCSDTLVDNDESDDDEEGKRSLIRMGAATALAITIHNLPEGLVAFISYMDDPAVGVVLAIGIAIHNIPEGLCVALPIYYATGNRWKAFLWGILSGVSEPLGALMGYFVVGDSFSGNTYGLLFGVVAGIMTMLAVDELLPNALRYDRDVVTGSVLIGMAVMAVSLMLFSA